MTIDVKLICARTEIVIGEDIRISVSVTSTSAKSQPIPDINRHADWPQLRVRDLAQGTEQTYGPQDLERAHQHEFLPPPPKTMTTLPAGGLAHREARLLRWIKIPRAGKYEITALMPGDRGTIASAPVAVHVLPLKLQGAILAGQDGTNLSSRTCIWSHGGADGAVVFLSMVAFAEGHARLDFSERITEIPELVTPIPSISPRARLYPAHWLAWISPQGLQGSYFLQKSLGPAAIARGIEAGQLLSPGLLDWTGATRNKPARVQVGVWHASHEQPRLGFYLFESDGSIAVGAPVTVSPGDLRWSGAVLMSDGDGRWVLVMQRNDQTHLDILGGFRVGTVPVAPYSFPIARGTAIGARILLTRDETLLGAVAVSDAVGTVVIPWEMKRNAGATLGQQIVLDAAGARIVRVYLAVGDQGDLLIVGQTSDGRWVYGGRNGVLKALAPEMQAFGEPIAAEFAPDGVPFAVMAAPETGIRYLSLSASSGGH